MIIISTTIRICPNMRILPLLLSRIRYVNPYKYLWHTRAVFGDLYSVEKIGGLRFRCPGYFINHLVISIPGPPSDFKKNISTQNGASPVRTVCSALDCVHRVYRVPSMTWSQSDSVGVYSLGSSLWPMLVSLWMGVSLCEYLILFVMCVCVYVYGRRPEVVKAVQARFKPRSEPW